MSADRSQIVHSHGGQPGTDAAQYNVPSHLAVDDNEFVFVADVGKRRVSDVVVADVKLHICQVVSRDQLKGFPQKKM